MSEYAPDDDRADYLADVTGQVPDASHDPIDVRIISSPAQVERQATTLSVWTVPTPTKAGAVRVAPVQRNRTRLVVRWNAGLDLGGGSTGQATGAALGSSDQFTGSAPWGGLPLWDTPNDSFPLSVGQDGYTFLHTGEVWLWVSAAAVGSAGGNTLLYVLAEYREDTTP